MSVSNTPGNKERGVAPPYTFFRQAARPAGGLPDGYAGGADQEPNTAYERPWIVLQPRAGDDLRPYSLIAL